MREVPRSSTRPLRRRLDTESARSRALNESKNVVIERSTRDGRLRITGEAPALTFAHADGRPYGTPQPVASDHAGETQLALRTLGFSRDEATAAVVHAHAHVGSAATVEDNLNSR